MSLHASDPSISDGTIAQDGIVDEVSAVVPGISCWIPGVQCLQLHGHGIHHIAADHVCRKLYHTSLKNIVITTTTITTTPQEWMK